MAAKLGVQLDESCKDVSRAFYYAAHPPGAERFFEDIPGRALDLAEFDEQIATTVNARPEAKVRREPTGDPAPA